MAILTDTADLDLAAGWLVLANVQPMQGFAILLCCVGIAILVAPLAATGIPLGLALAVGGGFSWAAGTVYLKWARIKAIRWVPQPGSSPSDSLIIRPVF